jgi:hypothetical protein
MASASAALAETKRLLSLAAGNSTSQAVRLRPPSYSSTPSPTPLTALADPCSPNQRRTFQEYLITLPKYPSYECKAFFGTLVAKFFAEFEDLQDATVDAVLDLCEDDEEKVSDVKWDGADERRESSGSRGSERLPRRIEDG